MLDAPVGSLKGVGPARAELLQKELGAFTYGDLVFRYPFRYVDKTRFVPIRELHKESGEVQLKGILRQVRVFGEGRKRRLVARLRDETGSIELVWFKGVYWLEKSLVVGKQYVVYGRINEFNDRLNMPHPEIEEVGEKNKAEANTFAPVYSSTEKLNSKGLDNKARRRMMKQIFDEKIDPSHLPENLPRYVREKLKLPDRFDAIRALHFPTNQQQLDDARRRMKFEELFFLQLRLLKLRKHRRDSIRGHVFQHIGDHFNQFYKDVLPFELTKAQKRVLKEIRKDLGSGVQMNRLLQGDVGSGKTVVGLMCMLMALDNGYQAVMLAPTQILAQQHFDGISEYLQGMNVNVAFLSGSTTQRQRRELDAGLRDGSIHILVGTHAILEDWVTFQKLGLAITDEQHRFGVKQRAKLWNKSRPEPPHVLVMTATPIPRTLAMTLYGDLDVSVIDELPPGRKPVTTVHRNENHRMRVFGFLREELAKGRQAYIVYPLIEESETLDLKNLQEGYEAISREFPLPDYAVSIVHGRMKPDDKEYEMQRFKRGETQIMVATTVIEVGVNVPNASVMIIENTERFGLSQLHQLRGRVGRGAEQSYCILMASFKLSAEGRERIQTMCRTNNGFEIAEADLKLRGPGNIEGTQQSGLMNLTIANLAQDGKILQTAREVARRILDDDPFLQKPVHFPVKQYTLEHEKRTKGWGRIS